MIARFKYFFVMIVLLLSFGSRITLSVIPIKSLTQKIAKHLATEKADTNETQLEEKLKVEDIIVPTTVNFAFLNELDAKASFFAGNFNLASSHLPTLEYPPK